MSYCSQCGNQLKKESKFCDRCGVSVTSNENTKLQSGTVKISFPVWKSQMIMNNCYVYDSSGVILASCKQGETVELDCDSKMDISVKMQNCFGQPKCSVNPGDKLKIDFRGFGKIYIAKVDQLV